MPSLGPMSPTLIPAISPYTSHKLPLTRHRLMCLDVPQLDIKSVGSLPLSLGLQIGHHNRVVRTLPQSPGPPLGRCDGRRVKHELLGLRVVGRRSLQFAEICPMAQFRLGVPINSLPFSGQVKTNVPTTPRPMTSPSHSSSCSSSACPCIVGKNMT